MKKPGHMRRDARRTKAARKKHAAGVAVLRLVFGYDPKYPGRPAQWGARHPRRDT